MTSAQIAELRQIADGYAKDEQRTDYREREMALAALPRLLEEREALLEAAKRLMDADLEGYDPLGDLRAAIEKAESP